MGAEKCRIPLELEGSIVERPNIDFSLKINSPVTDLAWGLRYPCPLDLEVRGKKRDLRKKAMTLLHSQAASTPND
uniref:Uncharacterized protein n=1 Tax=Oryza rufipogon TaxID=4529 RepID=A0A0E0Q8Y1_ORYRU